MDEAARLLAIRARHPTVPGIDTMSLTHIGGRLVFGIGSKSAATQEDASDTDIDKAIQIIFGPDVVPVPAPVEPPVQIVTAMPAPTVQVAAAAQPQEKTMGTPSKGSFAAELQSILAEGMAGIEQAKADGRAKVRDAVKEMAVARDATVNVSDQIANRIRDQTASLLSDIGQITNNL